MASEHYDESNEVWPYFLITVWGVVLIPTTISFVLDVLRSNKAHQGRSAEHTKFRAGTSRSGLLGSWKAWFVAVGWVLLAALIMFVKNIDVSDEAPALWDPYSILQVARSASAKEIKSAYRKLSLQFHPDKLVNMAEAEKERLGDVYVDIVKAYQALTDEVTRENFLQYGHPDGPQPVVHGIALPSFFFANTASFGVLAFYVLLFGAGVPFVVSKWWRRTTSRTRNGLLQSTAEQFVELLVKEQPHFITRTRVLHEILKSDDMTTSLSSEIKKNEGLRNPKTRFDLLLAFLDRKQPTSQTELKVATESARLVLALHDIAVEFKHAVLCQRLLDIHRQIVQAVSFGKLAQASACKLEGLESIQMKILRTQFIVPNEELVTPNSVAFLAIYYLVLPKSADPQKLLALIKPKPVSESAEKNAKKDDKDSNKDASKNASKDSGNGVHDFIAAQLTERESELRAYCSTKPPASYNETQPVLGTAAAPYFPLDVKLRWFAYLYAINNKLAQTPFEIKNMDLSNLSLDPEDADAMKNLKIGTLVVPLASPTPMEVSLSAFKLTLTSSCYFGSDAHADCVLQVVPPPSKDDKRAEIDKEIEEIDREDRNDSSDEEDEGYSDIDTSTEEEDNAEEEDKK